MKGKWLDWIIFIGLCLIWGSSFILMKRGMFNQQEQPTLTAFHVGALRMLSAGIILLPVAFTRFRNLPVRSFGLILVSALCGSFFPSFLFCIAETKINSALAGTLNALTPLFVIIIGTVFFNNKASTQKVTGIVIGLIGSILLFLSHGYNDLGYIGYASFVLLATIFYGINVNTVQRHLKEVGSIQIAAFGFVALIPASLLVLYFTNYFDLPLVQADYLLSTVFSCILGILGTAFATIIFYILVKRTSALFSSLVTYGIPFVAIGWGLIAGEEITFLQTGCLGIILFGVYIATGNKKIRPVSNKTD